MNTILHIFKQAVIGEYGKAHVYFKKIFFMKYIWMLLFVFSCTNEVRKSADNRTPATVVRFIGDSITEGWTLADPKAERWTAQLCKKKGWNEDNRGVVSMSLQDADYPNHPVFDETDIPEKEPTDKYLFIDLGVNDEIGATNGYPFTVAGYKARYQAVIDYAIKQGWSKADMVLLTPFYVNGGSVPDANLKENYRQAVTDIAHANQLACVDLYTYMKNYPNIDSFLPDFVHPNAAMHEIIANYLAASTP